MWRMVFLLVFSSVSLVHIVNGLAVVEIIGKGLTLDNGTIPYKQKYSYTFKEPGDLNLTCVASGFFDAYKLVLQDERGIGTRGRFFEGNRRQTFSIFYQFKLTLNSRTISCYAKVFNRNGTSYMRFTSTVDLKYEPDSTTAPSTSTTTKPTAPAPIEATTGSAEPETPVNPNKMLVYVTPRPPMDLPPEVVYEGDSVKIIVIACLCCVIVTGFIFVIICICCSRTQVNPNKMAECVTPRPPMDLPPEVVYEEVYSHGAGLQRPRWQPRGAAPQHQP